MRVLTQPDRRPAVELGTFRVAEPLAPINDAQESLRSTFLARRRGRPRAPARRSRSGSRPWSSRPLRADGRGSPPRSTPASLDRRLESARRPDRGPQPRRLAQPHARPPPARLRARARVRLRRLARAADPAGDRAAASSTCCAARPMTPGASASTSCAGELRRMERLIADMLTLAREDAGASMQAEPIDLADCFDDLRRDLPLIGAPRLPGRPSSAGPWWPTPTGSPRCCATWSATRSRTRPRAERSRSPRPRSATASASR